MSISSELGPRAAKCILALTHRSSFGCYNTCCVANVSAFLYFTLWSGKQIVVVGGSSATVAELVCDEKTVTVPEGTVTISSEIDVSAFAQGVLVGRHKRW